MRLYTFTVDGHSRLGAELNGRLVDLEAARAALGGGAEGAFGDMPSLIRGGAEALDAARQLLGRDGTETTAASGPPLSYALGDVILQAPLPQPGKILCSGVNYRSHKQENPDAVFPATPGFFAKLPNTVIGPQAPIVHPRMTEQLDYEVELAVVLGRPMRHTPEAEAMDAVFGYTILHDVSARDIQFQPPAHNQITLGKNFDTFAPMGPCIVTRDELPDPAGLGLRTWVNDRLLQNGSNREWIFPLPRLLSFLSAIMRLEPGDVVTTGTPAGVGFFRDPQVFLRPGDRVALEIDGIGRLQNPVVAET